MTIALRPIETASYAAIATPSSFGAPPRLEWLAIASLVIDPDYQREITAQGRGNVRRIAAAFAWSMFAPVVVAAAGGSRFAIVDGQHRVTAAALCGIERVPCAVIEAARAQQAASFRAINGNVTKLHAMAIFHAALVALEPKACRIAAACAAAHVRIARYPKPWDKIPAGETLAPTIIGRALEKFGDAVVTLALRAISLDGAGNPGLIRAPIIWGTAEVLHDHAEWRDAAALLAAFAVFDLRKMFDDAAAAAARTRGSSVTDQFEGVLVAALAQRFAVTRPKPPAPARPPKPPQQKQSEPPVEINGILIDRATGAIVHNGKKTALDAKGADLVIVLARASPHPLPYAEIIKRVWGGSGNDGVLYVTASGARRKLAQIGLDLKTVPKFGFALAIAEGQ